MSFDDLTPNQIQPLKKLIEALNSDKYSDEFVMGRRVAKQRGYIQLYDNDPHQSGILELNIEHGLGWEHPNGAFNSTDYLAELWFRNMLYKIEGR